MGIFLFLIMMMFLMMLVMMLLVMVLLTLQMNEVFHIWLLLVIWHHVLDKSYANVRSEGVLNLGI
jgi:hypothetical protein